jgi:hypothetical protein
VGFSLRVTYLSIFFVIITAEIKIVIIGLLGLLWCGSYLFGNLSTTGGGTSPRVSDGIRELGAEAEPSEDMWVSLGTWGALLKGLESVLISSSW